MVSARVDTMDHATGSNMFMDESAIALALETTQFKNDAVRVGEILAKAKELKGLGANDVAALIAVDAPDLLSQLFDAARFVKESIYGPRIVLFAPLYISNLCTNECLYCAFRATNKEVDRRVLTQEEIAAETKILVEQGHKRLLLVAGESYPREGFRYVLKAIETVYATRSGPGEIRRVNVNLAPLTIDAFKELKAAGIGTYQMFQETYHRETYGHVHIAGPKRNYDWRITAFDRAMQAGIDDVGAGFLLGLYDWRFEVLALMRQAEHLDRTYGAGPHTISVPRMEPAVGSEIASNPPHLVTDEDFLKVVAIFRMAVPYTGIIMSTREGPAVRRASYALGVSQISAGSRTNPGGYADGVREQVAQFQLGDHRPLDEVVRELAELEYIPSFCTACYRLGRTGHDFMEIAKPGDIKDCCGPNALSTFLEYLLDYASPETFAAGEELIRHQLDRMEGRLKKIASEMLARVRGGRRDVYI